MSLDFPVLSLDKLTLDEIADYEDRFGIDDIQSCSAAKQIRAALWISAARANLDPDVAVKGVTLGEVGVAIGLDPTGLGVIPAGSSSG